MEWRSPNAPTFGVPRCDWHATTLRIAGGRPSRIYRSRTHLGWTFDSKRHSPTPKVDPSHTSSSNISSGPRAGSISDSLRRQLLRRHFAAYGMQSCIVPFGERSFGTQPLPPEAVIGGLSPSGSVHSARSLYAGGGGCALQPLPLEAVVAPCSLCRRRRWWRGAVIGGLGGDFA